MDAVANSRDRRTDTLWIGGFVRQFGGIEEPALRKLDMLHQARDLTDLRARPANPLEALSGDRRGHHSIRINNQWSDCFVRTKRGPENVEIVDYR